MRACTEVLGLLQACLDGGAKRSHRSADPSVTPTSLQPQSAESSSQAAVVNSPLSTACSLKNSDSLTSFTHGTHKEILHELGTKLCLTI